jgi:hypothetical protein
MVPPCEKVSGPFSRPERLLTPFPAALAPAKPGTLEVRRILSGGRAKYKKFVKEFPLFYSFPETGIGSLLRKPASAGQFFPTKARALSLAFR